ncbi:hypothetical protein FSARC_12792 [Fusarium sarcochroum]|uniref:Uncharacterized protein n=1 Tax=Fusarium sarcochroum TaxID=1208366 RepID=A0A8H4WW02_9HYPO|nr:hypothetical protein FSARC_12792 [Fusarium sarcochroum]
MDFVKNAIGGNKSGGDASKTGSTGSTENQDYVDKAASFVSNKAGINVSRDNQEKATDFARGQYEKSTGSKIDPKISN